MATLAARQTGNFTDAATWGDVPSNTMSGSTTYTAQNVDTTARDSAAFAPGAIEVDGIGVFFANRVASPTGTLTVTLRNSSDSVDVASVTVNQNQIRGLAWAIFPISAVTLVAGKNYVIRLQSSVNNQVTAFRTATTNDWHRFLRRTATASPGTDDKLIICGHLTGAGTGADITVTMNNTAATSFGLTSTTSIDVAIEVGLRGILAFGVAASTNYLLTVKGYLRVSVGGTLTIGTEASPLPSTSTATLQFSVAASGDSGLRVSGTFETRGPERKAWTNLTADAAASQAVLAVESTTGWRSADILKVYSTTSAANQTEEMTISTVDSSTQVTLTGNLANAHKGSDGFAAGVVNTSAHITIAGSSASLRAGFGVVGNVGDEPTTKIYYAAFRFTSVNAAGRRNDFVQCPTVGNHIVYGATFFNSYHGIEIASTSNVRLKHCAFTDIGANNALAGTSSEVEDCHFGVSLASFCIACGIYTALGTFKRNKIGSVYNTNSALYRVAASAVGSVDIEDIEVYAGGSGAGIGIEFQYKTVGTIKGAKIWNINGSGISASSNEWALPNTVPLVIEDVYICGCGAGIDVLRAGMNVIVRNGRVGGSADRAMTRGFYFGDSAGQRIMDVEEILCSATGYYTLPTNFAGTSGTWLCSNLEAIFRRCQINGISLTNISDSKVSFTQYNQTAGDHRVYEWPAGHRLSDAVIARGGTGLSERLQPLDAALKLRSAPRYIQVPLSGTKTVSVYVRKSVVGDGAAYNGNEPRLVVLRNIEAGITADTVMATLSGAAGDWILLSGTTPSSANDNNVMTIVVDCDGTAGWVNVDDWAVS